MEHAELRPHLNRTRLVRLNDGVKPKSVRGVLRQHPEHGLVLMTPDAEKGYAGMLIRAEHVVSVEPW